MLSVGEVGQLYRWLRADATCACLVPIRECSFWRAVNREHAAGCLGDPRRLAPLQRSIESQRHLPALLLSLHPGDRVEAYGRLMRSLFGSLAHVSGKRWIVDSSKSARHYTGRALALERYAGLDVKAIHLVRHPCGVAWSAMRGEGSPEWEKPVHRPRASFLRSVASWAVTNALTCMTARQLRRRASRIRYEYLCAAPGRMLERIGEFVGLDMSPVIGMLEERASLRVGHNVGGNRVRFNRALT